MKLKVLYEQIKDRLRGICFPWYKKDVAILGSINTLNTGDIAIIKSVQRIIKEQIGKQAKLLSWRHYKVSGFKHIVICGGDVLHDRSKGNLERIKLLLANNKKVTFLGVGVPGFYLTDPLVVKQILSRAHSIVVRDFTSFNRLKELGLSNIVSSFDNAFLLHSPISVVKEISDINIVGISIKSFTSVIPNNSWTQAKKKKEFNSNKISSKITLAGYIENYKGVIRNLELLGLKCRIICFTYEDEVFAKTYFKNIDCQIFTTKHLQLLQSLDHINYMFFTRYHSLVFALLQNKAVCGFAYADKVENLLSIIENNDFISRSQWHQNEEFSFLSLENFREVSVTKIDKMVKIVKSNALKALA
jgi:polysaccharide pyruvyl transferase WcaK-like protein